MNACAPYPCPNATSASDRYCGICWMVRAKDTLDAAATMNRMLPAMDAERTNKLQDRARA